VFRNRPFLRKSKGEGERVCEVVEMNEVRPFLFCEPNMLVECERHKLQEVVAHKSALITDKLPHDAVVYPCQL
jgi:hypothetical protein